MSRDDPRRDGSLDQRLSYWEERLANAKRLGRPKHIAKVQERVDALSLLVTVSKENRDAQPR